jgi:hypothetical protein
MKPAIEIPSKIDQTYLDQTSFWLIYFLCVLTSCCEVTMILRDDITISYFISVYLYNLLGFWSLVWKWTKK